MHKGYTYEDSYEVSKNNTKSDISRILGGIFGKNDDSYFIISERSFNKDNSKCIVLYIEDGKMIKHTLFFKVKE